MIDGDHDNYESRKCAECRGRGFLFTDDPMRRLPCLNCRCTGFVLFDPTACDAEPPEYGHAG